MKGMKLVDTGGRVKWDNWSPFCEEPLATFQEAANV